MVARFTRNIYYGNVITKFDWLASGDEHIAKPRTLRIEFADGVESMQSSRVGDFRITETAVKNQAAG